VQNDQDRLLHDLSDSNVRKTRPIASSCDFEGCVTQL
jgi:hypothetical protein